jgi:hypothetical protein
VNGRRIPRTDDEHLLREVETLFAFGPCRLCEGRFPLNRWQEQRDYHRELFVAYAPQRRRLEQLAKEQEARLGARLVCQTPGMPAVTERQLRRHEQLYGPEGIAELLPFLHLSGTSESRPATRGGKRPVRCASAKDNGYPWATARTRRLGARIVALHRRGRMPAAIADSVGKTDAVVRRYLREAKAAGSIT